MMNVLHVYLFGYSILLQADSPPAITYGDVFCTFMNKNFGTAMFTVLSGHRNAEIGNVLGSSLIFDNWGEVGVRVQRRRKAPSVDSSRF